MNIFKILASNDGCINEPNITSFLAYLLDAKEDHGLKSELLCSICSDYRAKYEEAFASIGLLSFDEIEYEVKPEFRVSCSETKQRDIDVLVEIFKRGTDQIEYAVCIENKIKDKSFQENQLYEEYIGLENFYKEREDLEEKPKIYLCLISQNSPTATRRFNDFVEEHRDVRALHLFWDGNGDKEDKSIHQKLVNIMEKANKGKLDPISGDALFVIKSFLAFISSRFVSREEKICASERRNYGKPVIEYLQDIYTALDEKKDYTLEYIKKELQRRIKGESGKDINKTTLYCQTKMIIVNEKNRISWHATEATAKSKDLLFYPDENKKNVVRKYNHQENITVYYAK